MEVSHPRVTNWDGVCSADIKLIGPPPSHHKPVWLSCPTHTFDPKREVDGSEWKGYFPDAALKRPVLGQGNTCAGLASRSELVCCNARPRKLGGHCCLPDGVRPPGKVKSCSSYYSAKRRTKASSSQLNSLSSPDISGPEFHMERTGSKIARLEEHHTPTALTYHASEIQC